MTPRYAPNFVGRAQLAKLAREGGPVLELACALSLLSVVLTLATCAGRAGRTIVLRALVPSYRFFDRAVNTPRLWVRIAQHEGAFGAWRVALTPARRPWSLLWHNPDVNLGLAYIGLCERLLDELNELPNDDANAVEQLVSYRLVAHLAERALTDVPAGARFQFKLTRTDGEEPEHELLISAPHELGAARC